MLLFLADQGINSYDDPTCLRFTKIYERDGGGMYPPGAVPPQILDSNLPGSQDLLSAQNSGGCIPPGPTRLPPHPDWNLPDSGKPTSCPDKLVKIQ